MSDPDVLLTVRLSEASFAPPSGTNSRTMLVVTGVGALALGGLGFLQNGLWILSGVAAILFLSMLAVSVSRRAAARQIASGTVDDRLLLLEIRTSGLRMHDAIVLPWEGIDYVEFLWKGAGAGSSIGMSTGQKIGQQVAHRMMSQQGVDGSKRELRVIPRDYAALKAATPKGTRGWLSGPLLGQPGWVILNITRAVDDDGFRAVLESLDAQLRAHGSSLRRTEI